jgi:hypothetical protein
MCEVNLTDTCKLVFKYNFFISWGIVKLVNFEANSTQSASDNPDRRSGTFRNPKTAEHRKIRYFCSPQPSFEQLGLLYILPAMFNKIHMADINKVIWLHNV